MVADRTSPRGLVGAARLPGGPGRVRPHVAVCENALILESDPLVPPVAGSGVEHALRDRGELQFLEHGHGMIRPSGRSGDRSGQLVLVPVACHLVCRHRLSTWQNAAALSVGEATGPSPLAFAKYIALSACSTNRSKVSPWPGSATATLAVTSAVVVGAATHPRIALPPSGGGEVDSGEEHDELLSAITDDDVTEPRPVEY